jgi:hypothetical protein
MQKLIERVGRDWPLGRFPLRCQLCGGGNVSTRIRSALPVGDPPEVIYLTELVMPMSLFRARIAQVIGVNGIILSGAGP